MLHLAADVQVLLELAVELPEGSLRRARILAGLSDALDLLDPSDVAGSAAACREVLAPLLASPAATTEVEVAAVGHAHIDSAWLWPLRETRRKCARTFSNVLALAREYPELVFACSSAQQYAWMREDYPQLWDRLVESVRDGVFVPVGGMWVESDTNLPGSESLVRQLVEGAAFFAEAFGVECTETWLPDSFGYSGALPQLCRLAGSRGFLSQKMSWNQTNDFPHSTFWWEGIDGTRILTHFPPADTYGSELTGAEIARSAARHRDLATSGRAMLPFGYGDGGGGPTREMMEVARRTADLEGSPRVRVTRPSAFFEAARAEAGQAPVWRGEMYLELHRGVYTSQVAMKQGNRRAERLLTEAELWCTTATVRVGHPYPASALQALWREVLLLQFHDILPGSSIAWVHREARAQYADIVARTEALIDEALAALVGGDDDGAARVSPPSVPTRYPLEASAVTLAGDVGVVVRPGPPPTPPRAERLDDGGVLLTSASLRVEVSPSGVLRSVRDLVQGREVLRPGAGSNVLELFHDTPNRFDAWDLDAFYRGSRRVLAGTDGLLGIDVAEVDGVPEVRVRRSVGHASSAEQVIRLDPASARLDLVTRVDWRERHALLKVAFDVDVHAERYAAQVQFGHVWRPTHRNTGWDAAMFETCAHRWVHVADPGYGVALLNDGIYGHDVSRTQEHGEASGADGTRVRLTLLRAPRHPDPETDQGQHEFRYALLPGVDHVAATRAGYAFASPARQLLGVAPVAPIVTVEDPAVVVTAVKLAQDGSGDVVVRLHEAQGARREVQVTLDMPVTDVVVVDLHERHRDDVAALTTLAVVDPTRTWRLTLGPFQIVTLRASRT